jgi:hypothetical protein
MNLDMQIESLEGKFKPGQERSDVDKQGVLDHLREPRRREGSLYDFLASFCKLSQQR